MGLLSGIFGFFGGSAQKKASQQATNAQIAAINRGIDTQNAQYQQTRSDYLPYTLAGSKAIVGYGDFLGTNGADAQATAIHGLESSPFFQQNLTDANENLLANASATGGIRGGDTQLAVGQLRPALLQEAYQQALSGYGNLANLGLGATGNVAQLGANNAQNVSGLQGDIGTAQARNYLTRGGINAANFSNFGNLLDSAASAFLPGGAGGAGGVGSKGFSLGKALGAIL